MSLCHEIGHDRLHEHLAAAIQFGNPDCKRRGQRFRHHHEADAEAREHGLAEGAHIQHAVVGIHALQRCQRPAAVTEFAVVIVFDDPDFAGCRVLQQHASPRQTHHHSQRILVRRRGADKTRWLAQVGQPHAHAFRVDRDRHRLDAERIEDAARAPVTGIFDPGAVAMFSQQLDDDIQRLMDAGGDDYLVGIAVDRARDAQIFCYCLAQRHITAGVAIGQQLRARAAPMLVLQAAPDLVRK